MDPVKTDETRITGTLPNVHLELVHRTAPDGSAEMITLNLTATPNFESATSLLAPYATWGQVMMGMAQPWLNLMQANPLLGGMIPQLDQPKPKADKE